MKYFVLTLMVMLPLKAFAFEPVVEPASSRWIRFEERETLEQSSKVAGAILDVQLDSSHPIAFGMKQRVASIKTTEDILKPLTGPGTTVGVYTRNPVLSGYMPTELRSAFDATAAILSVTHGDGRVVLMEDSPTFRGFWFGTQRLLLNASPWRPFQAPWCLSATAV